MSVKKRGKSGASGDPFSSREQSKYESPIASREFITTVVKEEKGPMDFEALAEKLSLTGDDVGLEALRRRVGAMLRDGQLIKNRKGGLIPVDTEALIAGRISAHPDGFGFVITDDDDKDVYLNGKQMRQVLHGDRVVVCVTGTDQRGRREGRVVEVVERANKSLVGRLSIDRGTVVVLPDNKRIHQDLLISHGELGNAVNGDMVVAEITEQPTRRHQPVGRVVEVLGQHLRPGMEIDVALHSHGIPTEWPDEVVEQAASFSPTVAPTAAKERKDVRDLSLITIDGADARDFDDAVWCESLENGWRLIVAIADVAHYVSPDSPLDKEAVDRGTSVYFPGRVVPMLPEVLSNGLCSLNPDVDRLCMLCELTLDDKAVVKKTRFYNGIMRSHARLTYDQVSEMLTQPESDLRNKHQPLVPMIEELHRLYKALAKKRKKRGAIEFDSNETHIIFDENKKIREIVPIQRNDAHKLIEECMILANIEAAAFLEERQIPALYRVHAGPKADRLEDLRAFLALRSLSLGGGDAPGALDYAVLAEQIVDLPDRSVIQTVMLRSMQQAVYQPKNEGHFGLALDQYAHFTSPIRRYPDLLVHRAIKHALTRAKSSDYRYSLEAMQALGESCSMTERRAEEASREVVSWLKCEYMQEHVGSEFPGVISAVTSFGLFVELTGIHVEGLVHITNLSRDYYRFDQAAQALIGERTGRKYRLGESIVVRVAAVNLEDRKIDFNEVESDSSRAKSRKARAPEYVKPVIEQESAAPQQNGQNQDVVKSAEQRRQDKRRRKQKQRDRKRAAARAARKAAAASGATASQQAAPVVEAQLAAEHSSKRASKRRRNGKPATQNVAHADDANRNATAAPVASEPTVVKVDDHAANVGAAAHKQPVTAKKVARKKVANKASSVPVITSQRDTDKKGDHSDAVKKVASGKALRNKTVARDVVAQEPVVSKVAAKKKAIVRKKASVSQPAVGKVVAKKAVAKKAVAKKAATIASTSSKTAVKPALAKKAIAKKAVSKKAIVKKAVAKKAVAEKAVAKKAVAKKAVVSKVVAKKASAKVSAKKVAATRVVAPKAAVGKAVAKKVAAKKTATKVVSKKIAAAVPAVTRPAAGKVAAKKTGSNKISSKKAIGKKVSSKKIAASKPVAKKAVAKKAVAKKAVAKKAVASKPVAKKAIAKKAVASKSISKKSVGKKAIAKKIAVTKVTAKKIAVSKVTARKVTAKKAAVSKVAAKKRSGKKPGSSS
ncbi:ribonuclease R [Granulosicoccus antarcticus]|uniref:Ribonuclease R n=1 Tax=Granulosicoccus antarcticus IMCC3135 TaxID=1192854 RepID=A0A2Z2NYR3_9GAMM|nr:ribonuclease R [Granulosicoccus antarcticus]ASJ75071.1 Ribonuclease R [Granulosicoccus antarcticus IMCC3135]